MIFKPVQFIKWTLTMFLSVYVPHLFMNLSMDRWDPILKHELEDLYLQNDLHKLRKIENTSNMMTKLTQKPSIQAVELQKIRDFIYSRLDKLKNEGNCEEKKIIRCENSMLSGFGSTIHRHVICLHIALALNRIFFIDQPHFRKFNGLANFTALESGKCAYLKKTLPNIKDRCDFKDLNCYVNKDGWEINNKYKLLEFTQEAKFPAPKYIPGTLPNNIKERLESFGVKNTWHWFTSQLLGYMILRTHGHFKQKYEAYEKNTPLKSPVVGVHLRLTDKVNTESRYIPLERYIDKVNDIFENELKVMGTRYVYVASDDSRTIRKLREAFKGHDYVVQGNPLSHELRHIGQRQDDSPDVMEKILMDLNIMSKCSYNVVTYSSNIGRLVWELKTSLYPYTESETVVSMDLPRIFYGWYAYEVVPYYLTIRDHPKEETVNGIKIMAYKKGMLFHRHGSSWVQKMRDKSGNIVTAKSLRLKGKDNLIGLVYANDIREWPGRVDYKNDL